MEHGWCQIKINGQDGTPSAGETTKSEAAKAAEEDDAVPKSQSRQDATRQRLVEARVQRKRDSGQKRKVRTLRFALRRDKQTLNMFVA